MTRDAYVVLGPAGETFLTTVDRDRAWEAARNISGLVCLLPVVADFRTNLPVRPDQVPVYEETAGRPRSVRDVDLPEELRLPAVCSDG